MAGMDSVTLGWQKGASAAPSTRQPTFAPPPQAEPPTRSRPPQTRLCADSVLDGVVVAGPACRIRACSLWRTGRHEKALRTSAVQQVKEKEQPAGCQPSVAAVALLAAVTPSLLPRWRHWRPIGLATILVPPVAVTSSVVRLVRHRPDWTAAAWVAARMIGLMTAAACSVTPS